MSVRVPAPSLMKAPVPETIESSVVAVDRPEVMTPLLTIVPLLKMRLSVSLPPTVSVAPEATVTEEEFVRRELPTVMRPPAETVVAPLNALLPERVRLAAPSLISPPLRRVMLDGSMSPEIVVSTFVVSVRTALPRSVVPEKVSVPVKVEGAPKTMSPPKRTVFVRLRLAAAAVVKVPPLRVSGLVPSDVFVVTRKVPALRVVPPE